MDDVLAVVKVELRELLAQPERPVNLAASGPTVILVVGVNGLWLIFRQRPGEITRIGFSCARNAGSDAERC